MTANSTLALTLLAISLALSAGVPSQREARQAATAAADDTTTTLTETKTEGQAEGQPKITYSKQTIAGEKERVKLDCGVEGVDLTGVNDFSVSWSKIDLDKPTNSYPISTNDRVVLFSDKYEVEHAQTSQRFSLVIKSLTAEDTGTYRCTVNFGENQKINADVPVHLQQAPYFTDDFTKTLTVTVGDSISIDCQPGGWPKPDVYWERLNDELPYYGGKFFKSNQLDIPLVEAEHRGHYVCYADNSLGTPATSHVILEVQFPPDLFMPASRVFTSNDESAFLECSVSGYPLPEVSWYKEDTAIFGTANLKIETVEVKDEVSKTTSTLQVVSVTSDDLGQYSCKALNAIGKAEKTVTLTTKSPPVIHKQSRTEVWYSLEKSKERNSLPVVIECEAEGAPAPNYRWTKNGDPLIWQANRRLSLEDGTGNLLITDPTLADNGMYQCFAYNDLGTAAADPVYLVNITRIRFSNDGDPSDTYNLEAELGRPYKLSCPSATAYPIPKLDWVKAVQHAENMELEFVKEERIVADPKGSLWFTHITEADDTKVNGFQYICLASTPFEPYDFSIASIIELTVKDPADGAHNLKEESLNVESFPMFTSGDKATIKAGGESLLWCIYGGEPSPEISWLRSDGTEMDKKRFSTKNFGRTLVIADTQVGDGGEYECLASNGVGDAKKSIMSVTVEQAPTFLNNMTSQTVHEGATVTFTCDAAATTNVNYTWFLNGRVLNPKGSHHRRRFRDGTLTITDAALTDMGNYACNASSTLGYAYGQAALTVMSHSRVSGGGGGSCSGLDALREEVSMLRDAMSVLQHTITENHDVTKAAFLTLSDKLTQLAFTPVIKSETPTTTTSQEQAAAEENTQTNKPEKTKPQEEEETTPVTTLSPTA